MTKFVLSLLRLSFLAAMIATGPGLAWAQLSLPDTEFLEDAKNGRRENVYKSLVRGQSANTSNSAGQTALMYAAMGNHVEVIEVLVQNKGNVRLKDREGRTPLFWASAAGHVEAVEALLKFGAPPNDIDRQGTSALMIASRRGYEDVVRLLIAAKADVNLTDHTGRTALMWSAESRNSQVPAMLKKAGAR